MKTVAEIMQFVCNAGIAMFFAFAIGGVIDEHKVSISNMLIIPFCSFWLITQIISAVSYNEMSEKLEKLAHNCK